jgi:hypothetical protein
VCVLDVNFWNPVIAGSKVVPGPSLNYFSGDVVVFDHARAASSQSARHTCQTNLVHADSLHWY